MIIVVILTVTTTMMIVVALLMLLMLMLLYRYYLSSSFQIFVTVLAFEDPSVTSIFIHVCVFALHYYRVLLKVLLCDTAAVAAGAVEISPIFT